MRARLRDMPRFVAEHRWTRGHMSGYVDGGLSVPHAQRVEEHASRCAGCRELLSGLTRTVAALRRLERPVRTEGELAERVIARLREQR